MEGSQCYIAAPNGAVLCVDDTTHGRLRGRLYHAYSREAIEICNVDELAFELERFYDALQFPFPSNSDRTFLTNKHEAAPKQERMRVMENEKLLKQHGDMGTFIIHVQHRQNSSWQGRITWADKNRSVRFRSIWEMIKLIAEALDTVSTQEGTVSEAAWEEDV